MVVHLFGHRDPIKPGDHRIFMEGVDAVEIEGDALRLFVRRGPFGILRHTRAYHPPNDDWEHVELYRDRTAVVVLRKPQKEDH